jgi:hypothetical protein
MRLVFGSAVWRGRHLLALHGAEFVGDGARIERQPVEWLMLRSRVSQLRFQVQLEQAEHLRVAVLLDHIDALVLLDEFVHFARERIGPQAQIIGFDGVFVAQLVAAFDYAPSAKCRRR